MEEHSCYEAASHITKPELEILEKTIEEMKSIEDPKCWSECELKFHNTIAKASKNKLVYIFISSLSAAMQSYCEQSFILPSRHGAVPVH